MTQVALRSRAGRRPAKPDPEIIALEGLVSYRISLLSKLLERRLARLVSGQFGLAVAEYRVLTQVIMRPESTVRAIAARTLVDKAQVSRAVAALEERNLITRSISSADRRSPMLTATRSGRALIKRIAPLRRAQEEAVLANLDPDTVETLRMTLTVLFEQISEPGSEPPEPTAAERRLALRSKRAATD